ncbi:MAG: hypothetical protein ABIT37_06460 [Luteolibacter sp.]
MDHFRRHSLGLLLILAFAGQSDAVIFLDTTDPTYNTSTPGDNSGWQYEGEFNGFLGVPIAPFYFITANHIGGTVGDVLDFHGDNYTTIASQLIPGTDLRVWEVNHSKPFPNYAPLSTGAADLGAAATVFGRGTQKGKALIVSGEPKGWFWGSFDVPEPNERWGKNQVSLIITDQDLGEFLQCDFDNPGIANECHLSAGDSGGGVFVLESGLWRLAGINYAVDGPFRLSASDPEFFAALYDCGGLEIKTGPASWLAIANGEENVASSFYSSRVSASLPWLTTNVGPEVNSVVAENFSTWQKLYFTPAAISNPAVSGALADPDKDGIENLLEFALNLDPTFNERAAMTPATGIRGLPTVRLESLSGDRLTMEFVRRTPPSGAGLTYIPEFSTDLVTWLPAGTESATSLNSRWDRVKVTDTLATSDEVKRFARLRVVLSP